MATKTLERPKFEEEDALWTFQDLAEFTKIPVRTLQLYVRTEEIPSLKIGSHRRFDPKEIKKWLKSKAA